MKKVRNGFTLVELIVVVTIIAILGTVGFVSYTNYLVGARDSNRIAQVTRISDALQQHMTTQRIPLPEDYVRLENDGNLFGYQGVLGETALQTISYSTSARDPRDDRYFTYLVTASRNNFQILLHLEDSRNLQSFSPSVHAQLQNRYVKVIGSRLGALVEADTLIPLEQTGVSVFDTTSSESNRYRSYLGDNEFVEGTPTDLQELAEVMRDRGRGWRVENNSFTCFDPEGVFPCTVLAGGGGGTGGGGTGGGTGGGGGGGGPAPGTPGAVPPIVTWVATLSSPNITLGSSPSSSEFNNFEIALEANNANITVEVGNTNNTIVTQFGNDNITAGYGNNHITIGSGNNTINLGDGYNFIQVTNGGNNSLTFGNGDNSFNSPSGNTLINGGNGNNSLSIGHNDDTITLGGGNNTITGLSGVKNITLGGGNNTITMSGYGNHIMQFGNGTNIVNLSGGETQITTGTSGSLDITFGGNQNRTTTWRGGNLTVRDFWRWGGNRINVSQISDLNNCTEVNNATNFNGSIATISSSQGTLTIHVQDGSELNCNSTFIF